MMICVSDNLDIYLICSADQESSHAIVPNKYLVIK